jgi:iron-sulfur cluster assembly protein
MAMVTLQTAAEMEAARAPSIAGEKKDPLAGMNVLTAQGQEPGQKGIQITEKALKRIRVAMAKENVSPEQGGLRVGIQGGGCSGLSYNIRFDTKPMESRPSAIRRMEHRFASLSIRRALSTCMAWFWTLKRR